MTSSNTTLTSLWFDDVSGTTIKTEPSTPSKMQDEYLQFYTTTGLDTVARETGIMDSNGTLSGFSQDTKPIQIIKRVSPMKSPLVSKGQNVTTQPMVISGTPQRLITQQLIHTPKGTRLVTTPSSPSPAQVRYVTAAKRPAEQLQEYEYPEVKRKKEKGGKGLRHFSMKVCEKVQRKGTTSYNEVADELVQEFTDPRVMMSPADQQYDQKNIRRRVYDALNVLMAMNIISKEKKEIKWIGLPTNSAQECNNLEIERKRRLERIAHKTQQLQDLLLQQIAYKNVVERNRRKERMEGKPPPNSVVHLPFIIFHTHKDTVINCNLSDDKSEYKFSFDDMFEIEGDMDVLKHMGMAFGLEKNQCNPADLTKAIKMVPKALEPYLYQLAQNKTPNSLSKSILSVAGPSDSRFGQDSNDSEVAMATKSLSRQSSLSFNQNTPDDDYSGNDSGSDRSTPTDL